MSTAGPTVLLMRQRINKFGGVTRKKYCPPSLMSIWTCKTGWPGRLEQSFLQLTSLYKHKKGLKDASTDIFPKVNVWEACEKAQIEGRAGPHSGWKDHPGLIEKSASGSMMWLLIGVCAWSEEWQFTRRQQLGVCNAVEDRYEWDPSCVSFRVTTPSPALKRDDEFRHLSEPRELTVV